MRSLRAALMSVVLFALFACGSLAGPDRNTYVTDLAVQYATLKVIEKAEYPNLAAAKVVEIATNIRDSVDRGDFILVEAVVDRLHQEVPWQSLSPADAMLANLLINTVQDELTNRIRSGVITRETQVVVKSLAQTVIDAGMLML